MIVHQIETLTIEEFIGVINKEKFTVPDFNSFISAFYIQVRCQAIKDYKTEVEKTNFLSQLENKKKFNIEFNKVMDYIDDLSLDRGEILNELESKYKYRGKYKYEYKNGRRTKRSPQDDKCQ